LGKEKILCTVMENSDSCPVIEKCGYFVLRQRMENTLYMAENGRHFTLTENGEHYVYFGREW
jgi:ABC-type tungstate transport system permease subunit